MEWTPIKYRKLDNEEKEYFANRLGVSPEDLTDEETLIFCCPMPDDEQEILVTRELSDGTRIVDNDICSFDGLSYALEGNGDWDGVIAWTPYPAPYDGAREEILE